MASEMDGISCGSSKLLSTLRDGALGGVAVFILELAIGAALALAQADAAAKTDHKGDAWAGSVDVATASNDPRDEILDRRRLELSLTLLVSSLTL